MSAINTKIKTIILTAISAAILSACGGGGGGDTAALSTGSTSTGGSGSPAKNGGTGNGNANKDNSTAQTSTLSNKADKLEELEDEAPLSALNLDTPLHTSFISSASAQQGNPNVQLRQKETGEQFQTDNQNKDQGGLISSLDFKANDEVKLDGIALFNKNVNGSATQPAWTTTDSLIAKINSKGNTKADISEQDGREKNTEYAYGKSTLDDRIVEIFKQLKAERENLKKAKEGGADGIDEVKIAEIEAKIKELSELYDRKRQLRADLKKYTQDSTNQIAYFRTDADGLVFDKQFDGIYVIRFVDGTQIVMHDPAAAGWTYQTFAHYIDPRSGVTHGYQSLGDETKFTALPASGTATYNGLTTAYVVKDDQSRQLTANVKAIVDFGLKGVRFETANSQFHSLDANGRRVTVKGADYDMKGTAKWENGNLFLGKVEAAAAGLKGNLSGKFFGPSAAEIGGTYGLQKEDGSEHLIGGYGAKRQ
ncbi:transferrin-binding protein-like solute binding protein [Neisseria sicca]|mgnify:FL=1